MSSNMHRWSLLTLAAVVSALTLPARASESNPADFAPDDALLFVGVADVATMQRQMEASTFWKMMKDPAVKESAVEFAVIAKFMDEFKQRLATTLELEPDRIRNPLGGPLGLFVQATAAGLTEEPIVTLVASVADESLMKEYFEKATSRLKQASTRHESVSFANAEILYFTNENKNDPNSDEDDQPDLSGVDPSDEQAITQAVSKMMDMLFTSSALPPKLAVCLHEKRLIVSNSPDAAKDALRSEKRERPLSEASDYRELSRLFPTLGQVRVFCDIARLINLAEKDGDEDDRKMADALGVKGFRSVIGHAGFDMDGTDSRMDLVVLMESQRTGLAKILTMQNRPVDPPKTASSETLIFGSINLNMGELVDEVERITRKIDPAQADQMRAGLEKIETPDGAEINLRKELIDNLREPMTFTMAMLRPFGPDSARMILSLAHRDKAAMDRMMGVLVGLGQGMLSEREVDGQRVYDAMMGGFSAAATSDAILIGNTAAVEAGLRATTSDSLADTAEFKTAAKHVPNEAWGLFYLDTAKIFEAAAGLAEHRTAIQEAAFSNPSAAMALGMLQGLSGTVKEGKLDEFRRLKRYQAPSIMTISTIPEGLRVTSVQLRPSDN